MGERIRETMGDVGVHSVVRHLAWSFLSHLLGLASPGASSKVVVVMRDRFVFTPGTGLC